MTHTTTPMLGRDIFVRHTSVTGQAYVAQHRVWDADRFMAARHAEAERLNAEQKEGEPRKASAEQITREQFNSERTV